jgi:serine/threonine protein kinase
VPPLSITDRRETVDARSEPVGDDERWVERYAPGEQIVTGIHAWAHLGEGRRCETWLAWSTELWSQVAVKLPLAGQMDDPRSAVRLGEEAAILGGLHHPAIERLLMDRHTDPVPHIVKEYVEGPTIGQLVEDEGPLEPADAVRFAMQVASGLHYLHTTGRVHLDIKPANLILREGRAVIIDLELSEPVGAPGPDQKAHGTRQYMAPEQCRLHPADPGMDIFALGAVLYEVTTGERAFSSRRAGEAVEYAQLTGRPRPPRELRPEIPAGVEEAIWRLLEPEPDRRPRTASEVLVLLESVLPEGEEPLWPEFGSALLRAAATPGHLAGRRG